MVSATLQKNLKKIQKIYAGCSKSKKNKDMKTEDEEKDWTKVLFEVIIKILTLGFYHIEKHKRA